MRRHARQCALQMLYQMDAQRLLDEPGLSSARIAQALHDYWGSFDSKQDVDREFAERLVRGVISELETIDELVAQASRRWKLGRMDKVDRNVIRIAAYEILHCPDIPRVASINEAIEIAKRFGNQGSAAFINGILDQLNADQPDDGDNTSQ